MDLPLTASLRQHQRSSNIAYDRLALMILAPVDIRSSSLPGTVDDMRWSDIVKNFVDSRLIFHPNGSRVDIVAMASEPVFKQAGDPSTLAPDEVLVRISRLVHVLTEQANAVSDVLRVTGGWVRLVLTAICSFTPSGSACKGSWRRYTLQGGHSTRVALVPRVTFATASALQQSTCIYQPGSPWVAAGNSRNDASKRKGHSNKAAVLERLPAIYPSQRDNQTCFEMANNSAAHGSSLVDNDELRCCDEACESAALRA